MNDSSVALNTISSPTIHQIRNSISAPTITMASQKVTKMVVDVDLNCSDCYKKIKKVIGKIPEIRDQEYDVEKNKVKISVISCCPHKIRDKLRHKGGSSIQKIEIVEEKAKSSDKPKDAPKAKAADKDSAKPKEAAEKPKAKGGEVSKMVFEPVHGYPQMYPSSYPMPMVGYEGYSGGALHGYGMAPQPSGYGSYDYDYHHHHRNNRGNYYLTQENPQECSIM